MVEQEVVSQGIAFLVAKDAKLSVAKNLDF